MTDIQLNNLSHDPELIGSHYAAAFLFTNYLREQLGENAILALAGSATNGLSSIEALLQDFGMERTVDQLFADWLVANYLSSIDRGVNHLTYDSVEIPEIELAASHRRFPIEELTSVAQYGADFIRLQSDKPLTVTFQGSQRVPLMPTEAHSGSQFWSALPADKSDVSLTGRFDLRESDSATLTFWVWYEIEAGWDYAYLTISEDDGDTWTILETDSMTSQNPQGNNFGTGWTGNSGSGDSPIWLQQTVDLTPYVGSEILLRFEYVTDDAIHFAGFAVDDVEIAEIGFKDDMETHTGLWQAEGFIRHDNHLPQTFIIQAIYLSETQTEVKRLLLEANQSATWTLPLDDNFSEVVLIVAANTRVTQVRASYQYAIRSE